MGLVCKDDGWRLPDEMWAKMEPLLPPRKPPPLGGHNLRISDGVAMNAILWVLRTGMQWNALNGSGFCSSSSAHVDFQNGGMQGFSSAFGERVCWNMTGSRGSTGRGCLWTVR